MNDNGQAEKNGGVVLGPMKISEADALRNQLFLERVKNAALTVEHYHREIVFADYKLDQAKREHLSFIVELEKRYGFQASTHFVSENGAVLPISNNQGAT